MLRFLGNTNSLELSYFVSHGKHGRHGMEATLFFLTTINAKEVAMDTKDASLVFWVGKYNVGTAIYELSFRKPMWVLLLFMKLPYSSVSLL